MAKLVTSDVTNFQNEQTAAATLNSNFAATKLAMENTLSRDGTSPNQMTSQLDMNSNRILNLPAPQASGDPLRFGDISLAGIAMYTAGTGITINGLVISSAAVSGDDSLFNIFNHTDNTKIAAFSASGITTGTTRTFTFPNATTTLVGTDATQELTAKTLTSSVGKGTWTASGTWTIPAHTLSGTISGGGNQINNVIIGNSTPLAGSFTTVAASTSVTAPFFNATTAATGYQIGGVGIIKVVAAQYVGMFNIDGNQIFIGGNSGDPTNSYANDTHLFRKADALTFLLNMNISGAAFSVGVTANSPTQGMGYATGAGGAATQATNRSTGVTLSKVTGAITTNNTSLAAAAQATFTVTNTTVAATDVILVSIKSGQTNKETKVYVSAVAAGSFDITVHNQHASTAETGSIIINFAVHKGVTS